MNYFLRLSMPFCALVAGCAITPDHFINSSPILVVSSTKDSRGVAVCVSDGWNSEVNGVTSKPISGGFTVTLTSGGLIYFMAEVMTSSKGSTTKYWVGTFTLPNYIDKFEDIVKQCQS
ncbi:hypothetical protein [Methylomicrobium sp. Wu6]|uniref:hypothetical protein n=1 Tax=Methylomicrobium sp. Wu6 TaxID=3107928 RepID=UPI002DD62A30|nr:hypothetical protein [Methylomicrobium sp. Wu6]MEC4747176.1 hypothetical protein [Methylomicrobium sp. Wu6]